LNKGEFLVHPNDEKIEITKKPQPPKEAAAKLTRLRAPNQNKMVAASAMADRNTFGHLSYGLRHASSLPDCQT
jgi:hypothetical protein